VSRGLVNTIGCSNLAAWQNMKALGISDKDGVMVWSPLAGGFHSGKYTREKRGDLNGRGIRCERSSGA
jgi:aryl-alcohol dehydrogenase-like predicted oxidoreductase